MSEELKKLVGAALAEVPETCTVLLSGGVDSTALLLELIESGRTVDALSFHMDGAESTDFLRAKVTAAVLGVEFTEVSITDEPNQVLEDMRLLATYGADRKTSYECTWLYLRMLPYTTSRNVVSGFGADDMYGLTKEAMIHGKNDLAYLEQFRKECFIASDTQQGPIMHRIAKEAGRRLYFPWCAPSVRDFFKGRTWENMHGTKQKAHARMAWSKIDSLKIGPHLNMQCGDSLVRECLYTALQHSEARQWKKDSAVAIYNEITRQYQESISDQQRLGLDSK